MNILLLSNNYVVVEFVTLAANSLSAEIEVIENISDHSSDEYDFFIVDERGSILDDVESLMESLDISYSIFLCKRGSHGDDLFDLSIQKPFLPSDIESALSSQTINRQVLNSIDIDEIKSLLDDDFVDVDLDVDTDTMPIVNIPDEPGILDALISMKSKKIKQILRGAEINISIKFPKEKS